MSLELQYHLILKSQRKKRKMTQKEIAEIVGISRSYYNDIENGRTIPSGKTMFKINEVLPIFILFNDADRVLFRGGVNEN